MNTNLQQGLEKPVGSKEKRKVWKFQRPFCKKYQPSAQDRSAVLSMDGRPVIDIYASQWNHHCKFEARTEIPAPRSNH